MDLYYVYFMGLLIASMGFSRALIDNMGGDFGGNRDTQ